MHHAKRITTLPSFLLTLQLLCPCPPRFVFSTTYTLFSFNHVCVSAISSLCFPPPASWQPFFFSLSAAAATAAAAACKWLPDGKWHFHRTLRGRRGDLSSFQHQVLLIAWSHLWAQLTNSCKSIILLGEDAGTQGLSPWNMLRGHKHAHAY